ncbi:MAG TPA: hypothetical protein VHO72_12235 [Bacteroidales bacterium]|nr:hypothetical protein [Bacteroidales bacterium]
MRDPNFLVRVAAGRCQTKANDIQSKATRCGSQLRGSNRSYEVRVAATRFQSQLSGAGCSQQVSDVKKGISGYHQSLPTIIYRFNLI